MSSPKNTILLQPPTRVKGMTLLDKTAFSKKIAVPFFTLTTNLNKCLMPLKSYLLKLDSFKPVQDSGIGEKDVVLNPTLITCFKDFSSEDRAKLEELGFSEQDLKWKDIELGYENWKADVILKSVLPEGIPSVSGFSIVGHIIHLNLKDEHLPFKDIIGAVLLDKTKNVRTVINKLNSIDNTYRNFLMEVLAGEKDTCVLVKENGCQFEFDFSLVYWNPRLSTEHERIVSKLKKGDILFDVFAGVGPFSVPAAKKGCLVYANDLNPDSSHWLSYNLKKNHVSSSVQVYTLDGRDFITTVVRPKLLEIWSRDSSNLSIHIVMNLPALAVEFLDVFQNMCEKDQVNVNNPAISLPTVHCYCFVKDKENCKPLAQALVEEHLGATLDAEHLDVAFVRNVAPNKEMLRVSFQLSEIVMFGRQIGNEPQTKKPKLTE